ncbi:MAG: PilZ domain-containing protein [Rhizobiales bacterium]|nr:PilZ domain-containing protein [Hyphomicrobiales bacterium]
MTTFGKRDKPVKPKPDASAHAEPQENSKPQVERRSKTRKRTLLGSTASYNEHHFSIPCMIRDISDVGVRLKIDGSVVVPKNFMLLIELAAIEVECEIVWRNENELGAKYVSETSVVKKTREQIVSNEIPAGQEVILRHPLK